MKLGDIILFRKKGFISKIIAFLTKGPFTHAAIIIPYNDGDNYVIESDWGGVQINSLKKKYFRREYVILRHKDINSYFASRIVGFSTNLLGKKYDYAGIIGIARNILFGKYNTLDDKNRYWCSELVADAYRSAGLKLDVKEGTHLVSPNDLFWDKNLKVLDQGFVK